MSKHLSSSIRIPIDENNPSIIRNEEKCIRCGQCKNICKEYISIGGTYSLEQTNDIPICIHCGQCANICPVESITERYEYQDVLKAINNPDSIVIVSTSPSVRIALGEEFGIQDGTFVQGKMVALLRKLGIDYVLDTNFSADLTILEEASELIERITTKNKPLPQFTSCCPAWVKFVETYYPQFLCNISTSKSPIGMQGSTIKTYFAKKMGIDPKKIINVALTPCTAKKFEIRREEMNASSQYLQIEGLRDMDYVITTRELALLAKEQKIDFSQLEDSDFDHLMGTASGAGVIFGNTGGVMEAALRTTYEFITKEKAPDMLYELQSIRGIEEIKEGSLQIGTLTLNLAVIYGINNARKILDTLNAGKKQYHFIEVMTCPGGCVGGGGQPKDKEHQGNKLIQTRMEGLYKQDKNMQLRLSHQNEEVKDLYQGFYKKPLSPLAEQLLHTIYYNRSKDLGVEQSKQVHKEMEESVPMSIYKCNICGYIYDEKKEGIAFSQLKECPICRQPVTVFEKVINENQQNSNAKEDMLKEIKTPESTLEESNLDLSYPSEYVRHDSSCRYMAEIHKMSVTGKSIIDAMGTQMQMPNWDDILVLGAQLNPAPLDEHEPIITTTVIGKNAKKPMIINNPVYISHMSFGALSKETKIALSKGSAMANTAMCSGEGGILPEEMESAYKYIFEYVPNLYSVTKENLQKADAIEIKIGQGTKPGMGGHLPGNKVTKEIAAIRNKPFGQDVISPSTFQSIHTKEDLKALVSQLRIESDGRPIGIKIAAGRIERDMELCVFAQPDFITIDGRGGATGASPKLIRDATSVPTIYALYRARKYLDSIHSDISLVITGGLRVSSDFAKAIAMGADAIAIASAGLMAAACQQYRICGSGMCPVGVATQDETLRNRLKIDSSSIRVANFLNCSLEELKTFARITGHKNLHDLCIDDLCTINREISEFTNISHA